MKKPLQRYNKVLTRRGHIRSVSNYNTANNAWRMTNLAIDHRTSLCHTLAIDFNATYGISQSTEYTQWQCLSNTDCNVRYVTSIFCFFAAVLIMLLCVQQPTDRIRSSMPQCSAFNIRRYNTNTTCTPQPRLGLIILIIIFKKMKTNYYKLQPHFIISTDTIRTSMHD